METVANEVERDGGEVRIDIGEEGGVVVDQSRQRAWREAVDQRRRARFDRTTVMIIETTLALGGQAIGAVVGVALTSCASPWPIYVVELCIVFGLSFVFAAMSLRREMPDLSEAAAKISAIATALAIVIAVASNLPPVLAFAAGPFAFLIISIAVAFAS